MGKHQKKDSQRVNVDLTKPEDIAMYKELQVLAKICDMTLHDAVVPCLYDVRDKLRKKWHTLPLGKVITVSGKKRGNQ